MARLYGFKPASRVGAVGGPAGKKSSAAAASSRFCAGQVSQRRPRTPTAVLAKRSPPRRAKFDLAASLAKKTAWKPKTGPLKPLNCAL